MRTEWLFEIATPGPFPWNVSRSVQHGTTDYYAATRNCVIESVKECRDGKIREVASKIALKPGEIYRVPEEIQIANDQFSTQELIDRLEILAAQLPDEQCALVTTARNRLWNSDTQGF